MKRVYQVAAVLVLLLTFVVGRESLAVTSGAAVPDRLEIMFGQEGGISTTVATIDDSLQVRRIYAMLLALPDCPAEQLYCPNDNGKIYTLHFLKGNRLVLEATVRATGCRDVTVLHGRKLWAGRPEASTFWDQLDALIE